jgi:hypothetical protein
LPENKNVHILTGPNNSGKSILMKTVGLIVYLAHVGSVNHEENALYLNFDLVCSSEKSNCRHK